MAHVASIPGSAEEIENRASAEEGFFGPRDAVSPGFEIGQVFSTRNGTPFEGKARVLGVSRDLRFVALTQLDVVSPLAPFKVDFDLFQKCLEDGDLQEAVFDVVLATSESHLTERARLAVESNFKAIEPLLGPEIAERILFDPAYRREQVRKRAEESHKDEKTVLRSLLMYWFTDSKLGLAGPLKHKEPKEQARNTRRRGRPPRKGEPSMPVWKIRQKAIKGIEKYIIKQGLDRDSAYPRILNEYFSVGKKGARVPGVLRISKKQLRTLVEKELEKRGLKRKRQRRSIREQGRVMHSSFQDIYGPGHRYEIDATKIQIRIVSSLDRSELVKEATLYLVVDAWSDAIVGYAISLGPACMEVAREALLNAYTDKSFILKRLKIDIPNCSWLVCRQIPANLRVDRGELVSDQAGVVPGIGTVVEICPPYVPEWKAAVEQSFNQIKHGRFTRNIAGRHRKKKERGEDDGKAKAFLTLDELERIIVLTILRHNARPVPIERIPGKMLAEGHTNVSRIAIYAWGLKRRPGFNRKPSSDKAAFIALLAKAKASMTAKGLRYDSQFFFANEMDQLGYVDRAKRMKGGFTVDIGYQWRHPEQIWFHDPTTGEWYPAVNTDPEVIRKRCSYMELEMFRRKREAVILNTRSESIELEDRAAKILAITLANARKLTKQAKQDRKKTKNNVNEMTAIGRDAERIEKLNIDLARFAPDILEDMPEASESRSVEDQERTARINASINDIWGKGRQREGK